MVDKYRGAEADANRQAHHFPSLLRGGDGGLIALCRLNPDEVVPGDVSLENYLRNRATVKGA